MGRSGEVRGEYEGKLKLKIKEKGRNRDRGV